MLYLLVVLVFLIVLYFTGRKSVHQEILIDATPTEVWNVLTATEQYKVWNPVMLLKKGNIVEGQKVVYRFTQDADKSYDIPTTVKKIEREKLLNQGGGMTGLLTFDHRYIIEPTDGQTQLIIHEDYAGIGVNFWNPAPVDQAYQRLAKAIKERAEALR